MLMLDFFFRRIIKDLCHKELLPLKFIFFVKASTLFVLYPYITIHMRELGINVEETAIMSAITPFVAIIMPPLAGLLADRIGNFKLMLAILSSIGGLVALLLLLVPVGRMTIKYPDRVILDMTCNRNSDSLVYSLSDWQSCMPQLNETISTRLESCGYNCYIDLKDNITSDTITASQIYTVKVHDLSANRDFSYGYTVPEYVTYKKVADDHDVRENKKMTNNEFYNFSIRQLSRSNFFFPANQIYKFSCDSISYTGYNETVKNETRPVFCSFGKTQYSEMNNYQNDNYGSFKSRVASFEKVTEVRKYLVEDASWKNDYFQPIQCSDLDDAVTNVTVSISLDEKIESPETHKALDLTNCTKACIITVPRSEICSNKEAVVEYNPQLTFWLYLIIRVFIGIIGGTAFAMFEGAVIAILREQKADYGMQRIYGSIGGMISSPLSGLMIDYASRDKEYTDFRPAFYLYAGLKVISGALIMLIDLEFKSPSRHVVRDVLTVLKDIEIVALLLATFVLGIAWGYIESFLFWFLQDLGGSRSLMGITVTVGGIAGLPLLVLSGPIINKIGHANVIFIGFIFYAIRLVGYSLIYNPWHSLIFEALESVTSSLSFTAAVTYAAKLSTTTIDSSIQGLLGGLYYGVGKGFGSLVGGYLMKSFGTRPTYRIYAVVSIITGLIYFAFNTMYLRKRPQVEGNDIVKKKPKTISNAENGKANDKEKKSEKCNGTETDLQENIEMFKKNEVESNLKKVNADHSPEKLDNLTDDKQKARSNKKGLGSKFACNDTGEKAVENGVTNEAFETEVSNDNFKTVTEDALNRDNDSHKKT